MSRPTSEPIVARLRAQRPLLQRYGVSTLSLFGSVARGEAEEDSDVDLLVEFSRPIGFFEFVRLKRALEEILGRRVDLATPRS
ncbi:MAG: nucleotidyltransferase family protein, partial [Vicinamibacteria bacterium]